MESALRRVLVLIVKAVVFLPCCFICLWWAYSMRMQVNGGSVTFPQAIFLSVEMSFLTTVLTAIVWIIAPLIHRQTTWIVLAAMTALETALILILYTAAVVFWRGHWTPAMGMTDSAAFMPIVGHINAEFFAEYLGLEYLICVVPIVSVLSGVLTSSFDFLQKQRQLKRGAVA